jgi:hypothetical protein
MIDKKANIAFLTIVSISIERHIKSADVDGVIRFCNGWWLTAAHTPECRELHYWWLNDLVNDSKLLWSFKRMNFDLSDDRFFERVPNYGIRLLSREGEAISIPCYSNNNGYYSDQLLLHLYDENDNLLKEFDITECQSDL